MLEAARRAAYRRIPSDPVRRHVKLVQQMLGHASAAMMLDVYGGLFGDDLESVADRLDSLVPQMRHEAQTSVVSWQL